MCNELILYHGTPYKYDRPSLEESTTVNGRLYGDGMYFSLDRDIAEIWSKDGEVEGYINKYKLNTDGLNVVKVDNHGREMYETLVKLKTNSLDCDLVIIPSEGPDGYADELFENIIITDEGEEDIDRMCGVLESGVGLGYGIEGQKLYKFDVSVPTYEIIIRNQETLDRLVRIE